MRQGLIACVTCELLALTVWIGGLLVLVAAVIPAVFNTFGGQDTGGFFLTRAFEGYNRLVLGAATVLTLGILWRAWLVQHGMADGEITRTETAEAGHPDLFWWNGDFFTPIGSKRR